MINQETTEEKRNLVVDQPDFRAWEPEIVTNRDGKKGTIQLCADNVGGRWEYFYTAFKEMK